MRYMIEDLRNLSPEKRRRLASFMDVPEFEETTSSWDSIKEAKEKFVEKLEDSNIKAIYIALKDANAEGSISDSLFCKLVLLLFKGE